MTQEKSKAAPLSPENWNDVELRKDQKKEFEKDPGKEGELPPAPEDHKGS